MSQPQTNIHPIGIMTRVRTGLFSAVLLLDASFSLFGMCALGLLSNDQKMIMITGAGGLAGVLVSFLIMRRSMTGGVRIPVTRLQRRIMLRTLIFAGMLCSLWLIQYSRFPKSRGGLSLGLYIMMICAGTIYAWNQAKAYTVQKLHDPALQKVKTYENGSRFCMVAEKYHVNPDQTYTVVGEATGIVKPGDKLYLYSDQNHCKPITAEGCRLDPLDPPVPGKILASIVLPLKDPGEIKAYTVISSVKHYAYQTAETPVENPYLAGMAQSFSHMKERAGYVDQMFRAVAYGKYLVSIERRTPKKSLMDHVDDLFMEDTDFAYGIPVLTFKTGTFFPVYSGWDALRRSKDYEKHDTAVMSFQEIVRIVTEYNGQIVLDPFGPSATYFSDRFIKDIINSPGYKADFNAWEGNTLRDKMSDYLRTCNIRPAMDLSEAVRLFEKMCREVRLPDTLEEGKSVSIDMTAARDHVLIRLKRSVFRLTGDEEEAAVVISLELKDGETADCLEIQENRKYSFEAMMEQLQVYREYKNRRIEDISVE